MLRPSEPNCGKSLKATQPHVSVMQTNARQKMARNIFREILAKLCLMMGLLGASRSSICPIALCLIASGYPGLIQRAVIKYLCSHAQSPPEGEGGSILTKYSFSRLSCVIASTMMENFHCKLT